MKSARVLLLSAFSWIIGAGNATGDPLSVEFADGVAVLKTDRYEITWQDGSMVGLRTFLPQEHSLTVDSRPMQVAELPNGLATVGTRSPEKLKTYGVVASFPLAADYPAYHPPETGNTASGKVATGKTDVACELIDGGVRLTYRGLAGLADAVLVQELTVEPDSGDLVIDQQATSLQPGVTGIAFGMLNLRRDLVLAVPYFGGQRWDADYAPGRVGSWGWPYMWNAGLVIGEVPTGGSFCVWAEDPELRPKFLRRRNAAEAIGLGFESCAEAPFDGTSLTAPTWRFNTFAGSWIEPAERYKSWHTSAFHTTPRAERASAWVDDIALIVPQVPSENALQALKEVIDPKHLLFMQWGWLEGFNRRIPEYIPQNKSFVEQVALAHQYGAKVGVYTSLGLVDQEAWPTMMKDYELEYFFRGPAEEKPHGVRDGWLQYVHPGSAHWREFYSQKMAELQREYGIDYLYQDVTGCAAGSSGLVDGLTFSKAMIRGEEAIRQAAPQAAMGGEFWTDINACQEDFGIHSFQAWFGADHAEFITRPRQPHPILSYLFSENCVSWSHRVSIRDTVKFHRDQNINEVTGAIPVWATSPEDRQGEARAVLARAKLLTDGFRPYFPEAWEPDVVAYLRDPAGRVVKYVRPDESTFCYQATPAGNRLVYARVTAMNRLSLPEPATIDGWIAYDEAGPIGLNPESWYCAFPGRPPELPVTITDLPQGAHLVAIRSTDDYVLAAIDGQGEGEIAWTIGEEQFALVEPTGGEAGQGRGRLTLPATLLFTAQEPLSVVPGERLSLDQWQCNIVANGQNVRAGKLIRHGNYSADDKTVLGTMVHPPTGGKGSEISLDRLVQLPERESVGLRVTLGRLGGSGDGVHFVVRVNGREVWRQFSPAKRDWTEVTVPLEAYAGRAVVLSLALDCGPAGFNISADEAIWADPRIECE